MAVGSVQTAGLLLPPQPIKLRVRGIRHGYQHHPPVRGPGRHDRLPGLHQAGAPLQHIRSTIVRARQRQDIPLRKLHQLHNRQRRRVPRRRALEERDPVTAVAKRGEVKSPALRHVTAVAVEGLVFGGYLVLHTKSQFVSYCRPATAVGRPAPCTPVVTARLMSPLVL